MRLDRQAQQLVMGRHGSAHLLGVGLPATRRPLDVSEEKSHSPRRANHEKTLRHARSQRPVTPTPAFDAVDSGTSHDRRTVRASSALRAAGGLAVDVRGRADPLPARGVHQRGAVHRTLQERIRPDYPDLKKEIETQVVVGPDSAHAAQGGTVWRFTDDAHGWEVALAPEFIALATKTYSDRADFSMAFARGRSSDSISPTEPSSTSLLRAGSIWQPRSLPQPPQSSAPDA